MRVAPVKFVDYNIVVIHDKGDVSMLPSFIGVSVYILLLYHFTRPSPSKIYKNGKTFIINKLILHYSKLNILPTYCILCII